MWDDQDRPAELRLAVIHEDFAGPARRLSPNSEFVPIDSFRSFFDGTVRDVDGLLMAAEEGAAWNVLYPEHTVVVPKPVVRRPVGMAVRSSDSEWLSFLDRWLDFQRMDGSLDRCRKYWIEGGGTKERTPRWCVIRDVLHWVL
jgi:hypothetical protein